MPDACAAAAASASGPGCVGRSRGWASASHHAKRRAAYAAAQRTPTPARPALPPTQRLCRQGSRYRGMPPCPAVPLGPLHRPGAAGQGAAGARGPLGRCPGRSRGAHWNGGNARCCLAACKAAPSQDLGRADKDLLVLLGSVWHWEAVRLEQKGTCSQCVGGRREGSESPARRRRADLPALCTLRMLRACCARRAFGPTSRRATRLAAVCCHCPAHARAHTHGAVAGLRSRVQVHVVGCADCCRPSPYNGVQSMFTCAYAPGRSAALCLSGPRSFFERGGKTRQSRGPAPNLRAPGWP